VFVQDTGPGSDAAACVVVEDMAWLQGGSDGGVPPQETQGHFSNHLNYNNYDQNRYIHVSIY
jgi:hypothetical protein